MVELNVQMNHVHLLVKVPPRLSISHVIGHSKGKTALRLFSKFPYLRKNKLWKSLLGTGYCVDTVGINEEMIRKYVKYQEKHEVEDSQLPLKRCEGRLSESGLSTPLWGAINATCYAGGFLPV